MPSCSASFLFSRVDILGSFGKSAVGALGLFICFIRLHALLDEVCHLAERNELIADNLIVLIESHSCAVAFRHLKITNALCLCAVHGTYHGACALAEIFHTCADYETALGESGLCASVYYLEEKLSHSGIDGVTYKVCIESLEDCFAGKDFSCHGGGVSHTGAAYSLYESLFDNAVFDIERELAGALLRCAPAHTVSIAGNIGDLLSLNPFALFGKGCGTMVGTFGYTAHGIYFR